MNCERARDLLLEASPEELRGEGESDLGRHLAGCLACSSLARAFLEATEELERSIERLSRIRSDEEILRAVRRDRAGAAVGEAGPDRRLPSRRLWWIAAPVTAAAALATVLLVRGGPGVPARPGDRLPAPPDVVEATPVDVAADRRFAVMQTDNPTIHVVWFY